MKSSRNSPSQGNRKKKNFTHSWKITQKPQTLTLKLPTKGLGLDLMRHVMTRKWSVYLTTCILDISGSNFKCRNITFRLKSFNTYTNCIKLIPLIPFCTPGHKSHHLISASDETTFVWNSEKKNWDKFAESFDVKNRYAMRACVYCNVERRTASWPMLWHPQQTFEDNFVGFCVSPFSLKISVPSLTTA